MAASCTIKAATGLSELAKWHAAKDRNLKFDVSLKSSFGLAVEGMALGLLSELQRSSTIDVECTFDVLGANSADQLRVFDGLFGLALVLAARTVRTPSSANARDGILGFLWQRVQKNYGVLGDGKRRSLVSRDPEAPIPMCLRESSLFPKRDRFGAILHQKAISLGASDRHRSYSRSEEDAITFIYEATRNSWEHARFDAEGGAIPGIRGVLIDRLSFVSNQDLLSRRDLSELQRDYFQRQWRDFGSSRIATAYTVADLGLGIHRTLRPATPQETDWERLERAFRPGESRKPQGTDVESGMGLWKLYAAATRLKALLFVKSGGLLGYVDFSRQQNGTIPKISPWTEVESLGDVGTSLTLIWPRVDQEQLF